MRNNIIKKLDELIAKSNYKQFHLGCVILDKKGRIISEGFNQKKTHPMQYKFSRMVNRDNVYLHAEIAALVKCREQPYEIIVARKTKSGNYAMAKPCKICMAAIEESGAKRIVFTNEDGEFEELELT